LPALLGQETDAAHLDAPAWPALLVHHDGHPRVAPDVADLHVVLGHADVESAVAPFVPDRGGEDAAVGPVRRQDGGVGEVEEVADLVDGPFRHAAIVSASGGRPGSSAGVRARRPSQLGRPCAMTAPAMMIAAPTGSFHVSGSFRRTTPAIT